MRLQSCLCKEGRSDTLPEQRLQSCHPCCVQGRLRLSPRLCWKKKLYVSALRLTAWCLGCRRQNCWIRACQLQDMVSFRISSFSSALTILSMLSKLSGDYFLLIIIWIGFSSLSGFKFPFLATIVLTTGRLKLQSLNGCPCWAADKWTTAQLFLFAKSTVVIPENGSSRNVFAWEKFPLVFFVFYFSGIWIDDLLTLHLRSLELPFPGTKSRSASS